MNFFSPFNQRPGDGPGETQEPTPTQEENEPNVLPAFIYSAMLCERPGDPVDLNFFEPRYREMCCRMGAYGGGDNRFLFVPTFGSGENGPAIGNVCYVVSVQQMAELGSFLVRGHCAKVAVVTASWVEPLSGGLHFCKFVPLPAGATYLHRQEEAEPRPRAPLLPPWRRSNSSVSDEGLPSPPGAPPPPGDGAAGGVNQHALELWKALTLEADARCGDWTHSASATVVDGFDFCAGTRRLSASVRQLEPRAARVALARNVPFHLGIAALACDAGDAAAMRRSLEELYQRRCGEPLPEGVVFYEGGVPEPPPPPPPRALAESAAPAHLVSMQTLLRTLAHIDEKDLAQNPCADYASWSEGLSTFLNDDASKVKPRELKRHLSSRALRLSTAGVVDRAELQEMYCKRVLGVWRRRHLAAAIFNRHLAKSLRLEQVASMGFVAGTASLRVYPMVGFKLQACAQRSLEASMYYYRMGPRVEETLRRSLPDAPTAACEGVVHVHNLRRGNVNMCLLPEDVFVDAAAAQKALSEYSKANAWDAGCRLLWIGHAKPEPIPNPNPNPHPIDDPNPNPNPNPSPNPNPEPDPSTPSAIGRLSPELVRKICTFVVYPASDACWAAGASLP